MKSYGFVYIWRDKKRNMYYIGCHWGHEDDGYVCSSSWMMKSYKRRPEDFKKRRILARVYTNKKDLLEEEYRWLSMIKISELKIRYYNLHNHHFNHWSNNDNKEVICQKIAFEKRGQKYSPMSDQHRQNLSAAIRKSYVNGFSDEHKKKISESKIGKRRQPHSEETKKKMSISAKRRAASC